MGIDVTDLLAQYEQAPVAEPMHGRRGEVRRNPSADQKKVRRQMTVQKKADADEAGASTQQTIAQLLRRASVAPTLAEQQELITKVEQLKTAQLGHYDTERALDLTVKESVAIIPRGLHELHTGSTDWLMGLQTTAATVTEAEHALIAEATMWFERVPDYVKADPGEFRTQAGNLARRTASQYGEHADVAAQAFLTEVGRLYAQGRKLGSIKTASESDLEPLNWDQVKMRFDPSHGGHDRPGNQAPHTTDPHEHPKPGPHLDASIPDAHGPDRLEHPLVDREIARHMTGQDAAGVREMAQGYAQHSLRGGSLNKAASLAAENDELSAALAGFQTTALGGELLGEALGGEEGAAGAHLGEHPGMPGGGSGGVGGAIDQAQHSLDSSSDGVRDAAEGFAHSQVTGASQVPQVGGSSGLPTNTFPSFAGQPAEPGTSSNRSPALQELADFTGWDGNSVVPNSDPGLEPAAAGFPVSGSVHTASKEHSMDQAACPTCAGSGHVAVRKQAYSGLPQIDEIVSADETPSNAVAPGQAEHYPQDVAFPVNPNWGNGQDVTNAIAQTEQQIGDRNARSPLVTGTTAQRRQRRQANGRDNSGWMGDMGAKGTDYPGYSTPVGYDGSTNLGQPDPVYGFGGDQGDRPLRPYGEMEANDETNNPSQPYDPTTPNDAAQAYRTVSPGLSTAGSRDPFISQAQAEMARLQSVIATRQQQLAQRQG